MRGVIFVLALLGCIWLAASGWIAYTIWGVSQYCVASECTSFTSFSDKFHFVTMNATSFTWALAPIVVTIAVFPLLFVVIRQVRKHKKERENL